MKKLLLIMVLTSLVVLAGCAKNGTGDTSWYTADQKETLAQCLTDKGIVMYGTTRCQHCQSQKARFGDAADLITFIDCDESRIQCQAAGVEGFPTWIAPDGQKYSGDQPLESLATIGSCEL